MSQKVTPLTCEPYSMTPHGYYPNRTGECAITSLANLLMFQYKDYDMAQHVFETARTHSLVESHGAMRMHVLPQVLADISNKKYYGFASLIPLYEQLLLDDTKSNRSIDLFYSALQKNMLILREDAFTAPNPCLCFVSCKDYSLGHTCVVVPSSDEKTYIDNGFVTHNYGFVHTREIGTMVVKKNAL